MMHRWESQDAYPLRCAWVNFPYALTPLQPTGQHRTALATWSQISERPNFDAHIMRPSNCFKASKS